jgi:hypothetical protein
LGQKPTFSALSAAEMRFFKTHGFVKPLLREMLFRRGFHGLCFTSSARTKEIQISVASGTSLRNP